VPFMIYLNYEVVCTDPEFEVWSETRDVIAPKEKTLPENGAWTFPAASVSAVELDIVDVARV